MNKEAEALLLALAEERRYGMSKLGDAARAYLAARSAPPAEPPPVTVNEEAVRAAYRFYQLCGDEDAPLDIVRKLVEAAAPILTRDLREENAKLKKDCEVFITSNGAMTEELLALWAQLDRLRNPSEVTLNQRGEQKILVERIRELEHQVLGYQSECADVCQELGKALGYPWYKDDQKNFPGATELDGVCVGEHVPGSIALEAARCIRELKQKEQNLEKTKP